MSTEGFTTGLDVSIDIIDGDNRAIRSLSGITSFKATPMTGDLEHHGLDGEDRFGTTYRGWELTMAYDRIDGSIDAYFADREARYRGKLPLNPIQVTETIQEADGTISQYRFQNVTLKQDDPGTYERENKVSGNITGRAGKRVKVQ